MAIIRRHEGEVGILHPGDVVYNYDQRSQPYDLHAGIYVGHETIDFSNADDVQFARKAGLRVASVPGTKTEPLNRATCALWGSHSVGWKVDIIAQRLDFEDEIEDKKEIVFLARDMVNNGPPIYHATDYKVDEKRLIRGEFPLLVSCSCTHFVEYVYKCAALDIIDQSVTYDPNAPRRIYPSTQIYAFANNLFPLRVAWDQCLASYPGCLGPSISKDTDNS